MAPGTVSPGRRQRAAQAALPYPLFLPELADSSAREMESIAERKADLIAFGRGMAAVTSGIIWLAVAGLLLMAVRRTPKEQRRRALITALIALVVCGVALGGGLFWLLLLD